MSSDIKEYGEKKMYEDDEPVRVGWKDVIAAVLAMMQLILPVAVVFTVLCWLVMVVLMRFWIKT